MGSDTSQYHQEKKSTEITRVVASEMVRAQTGSTRVIPGLWDRIKQRMTGVNSLERQLQKVTAL
jgi:hypothetical protein